MKDIVWLMRNVRKVAFSSKRSILLYFGLPIIGILVSLLLYGGGQENIVRIGVVNHDSNVLAADTVSFMEGLEHTKVKVIEASEAEEQLTSGKLDSVVQLDAGFSQSLRDGNPAGIHLVSIKGAQVTSFVKAYLYSYIDNVAAIGRTTNGNAAQFDQAYAGYRQSAFKLTTTTVEDDSATQEMTYQTIGFLIMFMLFSAVNLSDLILSEKVSRTYFRLLSTPIHARQYVASNVLVNFIVMTLQIVITLGMVRYVFRIDPGIPLWQLFVLMLMFALPAIGLSLAIVAFAKSKSAAAAMQNLIITPTCLLAGCFFPVEIMPETVRKIGEFLPQRWLLDGLTRLQQGEAFSGLYLNLLVLLAFALAFFLLAVYRFSKNNDARLFG